jgi:hypothetical protein
VGHQQAHLGKAEAGASFYAVADSPLRARPHFKHYVYKAAQFRFGHAIACMHAHSLNYRAQIARQRIGINVVGQVGFGSGAREPIDNRRVEVARRAMTLCGLNPGG